MAVAASSYPQRPGETECQYYMKTGTCKYAQKCKFHHPPDVTPAFHPLAPPTDVTIGLNKESYPRRPGEQSCTFFLKTGTCKYKMSCKFDHPPEAIQQTLHLQNTPYPQRPGEQHCAYYLKTGKCKFGATCRYDHPVLRPNDHAAGGLLPPPSPYHQSHMGGEPRLLPVGPPPMAGPYGYGHPADNLVTLMPPAHPMAYTAPTAQQLPQRPGEKECTFFLKTARCQYGQRCKFHHPAEKLAGNLAPLNVMGMPGMAPYPMGPAGVPLDPYGMSAYGPPMPQGPVPPMPPPRGSGMGVVPGPGSHHGGPQDMGPGAAAMLPERPGVEPCGYYLRTGMCSYGMSCRFDHPRHVPSQDNHAMMNGHGPHADSHHATSSSGGHQQQPAAADAEETKSQDMGTEDGVQKKEADQKNDGAEYGQTNGHASEQTKTAPGYGGQNGHSPAYQQYPAAAGATPTTNGSGGYGDSNGYAGTGPQGAYVAPYGASATSAAGYGGYRAQA